MLVGNDVQVVHAASYAVCGFVRPERRHSIAVRHIESIIHISDAHAKAHLRNVVTDEDMRFGKRMLLESFIGSQKHADTVRG